MYFVYAIKSRNNPDKIYIGSTIDVEQRLSEHNSGKSTYTAKFKPWVLIGFTSFYDKSKAAAFEKYLKTCAGKAFAQKRLW